MFSLIFGCFFREADRRTQVSRHIFPHASGPFVFVWSLQWFCGRVSKRCETLNPFLASSLAAYLSESGGLTRRNLNCFGEEDEQWAHGWSESHVPFFGCFYPLQTRWLPRTLCSAVPWFLLRPCRCLKTAPPALSPLLLSRPPPFWRTSACCQETPVSRKQVSRMKLVAERGDQNNCGHFR